MTSEEMRKRAYQMESWAEFLERLADNGSDSESSKHFRAMCNDTREELEKFVEKWGREARIFA